MEGARGAGWRGGAHPVCGLEVHPLLHEALEGGEVAARRRIEKRLLRLRAQPSALSASQEPGWGPGLGAGAKVGARGRRRWRWRSMHRLCLLVRLLGLWRAVAVHASHGAYSCLARNPHACAGLCRSRSAYNHGTWWPFEGAYTAVVSIDC